MGLRLNANFGDLNLFLAHERIRDRLSTSGPLVPVLRSRATAEDGGGARGGGRSKFYGKNHPQDPKAWQGLTPMVLQVAWFGPRGPDTPVLQNPRTEVFPSRLTLLTWGFSYFFFFVLVTHHPAETCFNSLTKSFLLQPLFPLFGSVASVRNLYCELGNWGFIPQFLNPKSRK